MTKVIGSRRTFLDADDEAAMEFLRITSDIYADPDYQRLRHYTHHYSTTRFQHCVNVAWYTYLWTKKQGLNYRSATRGAMLHDFYLYDQHKGEQPIRGRHCAVHPVIALQNAKQHFEVDPIIEDCILHHMWPSCPGMPKTKEGMIVEAADKYCASIEWSSRQVRRIPQRLAFMHMRLARFTY